MKMKAWLIATKLDDGSMRWLRVYSGGLGAGFLGWTTDPSEALKFAWEKDARDFWLVYPQGGVFPLLMEHTFS